MVVTATIGVWQQALLGLPCYGACRPSFQKPLAEILGSCTFATKAGRLILTNLYSSLVADHEGGLLAWFFVRHDAHAQAVATHPLMDNM
eukprot:m.121009 g.121009  ORF g.121009 m.121009 type:complete len:89 (-) comp15625_c0_seq2:47-313(-)